MLNILINAYACSPDMGSEPGMSWNWVVNLAKHCELFIITEGEFRDKIEHAVPIIPQGKNMHFFYNPVSVKIRKMCWDQGNWMFYWYYNQWQKQTYRIACNIIKNQHIDIIHQLNMVGFREPGYLWHIKNIPFIWGPIAGMDNIPLNYIVDEGIKRRVFVTIKKTINEYQIQHKSRVKKAIENSKAIIGATKASVENIRKYYKTESFLINKTGCFSNKIINKTFSNNREFHIIWVGRFLFTKKLDLALKTIAEVKFIKGLKFHIVGSGSVKEVHKYKSLAKELCIDDLCIWHGNIPNSEVQLLMQKYDLFFFTSVMEATSTVILEAISNHLPIVCFDICGFGPIIDNKIGRKIPLSNPHQSVREFANAIKELYNDRKKLEAMSANCKEKQVELSWNNKIELMIEIYNRILKNDASIK